MSQQRKKNTDSAINAFSLSDTELKAIIQGKWVPQRPVDFIVKNAHDNTVKLRVFPDGTDVELPLE